MSSSTVLLTGATGFLGKVVLGDLLRRRAELGVARVVVLVRAADDAAARRRLEVEVLGAPCCADLDAAARAALEAVAGDVSVSGCDLAPATRARLLGDVTHVIHCAASIAFDLPLAEATAINVRGALHVQELAQQLPRLEALVSVSTAYVAPPSPDDPPLREELVPMPDPPEELLASIEADAADETRLLARTGHPNTYTLTKCLAEHLLVARRGELPLAIVRPSIIAATARDPFPGWIDSHAAFAGFVALLGLGHLRAVAARPETRLDVVPCDAVARAVVRAALERPPRRGAPPSVVHAVAGRASSASIADCRAAIEGHFGRGPGGSRIRYVGPLGVRLRLAEWAWHRVPAALAKLWLAATRDERRRAATERLRQRLLELNRVFPAFTHHDFDFRSAEAPEPFDARAYLDIVCAGVDRHLLRNDPRERVVAGREGPARSDLGVALRSRARAGLTQRAASVALGKILRRAVSRLTCDVPSFEAALAARRPGERLVIVPTHRSYLDFLVLPYLFFVRPGLGIPLPAIAADQMFARIPVLGALARRAGAFFLTRGRQEEEKELTREIHRLVDRDRTLLFFIEGGRSRTRAFLPPRRGLLRALQATGRDFLLLPVSISYDRVAEEASFAAELAGAPPARIRLADLAGWLGRVWRGEVDLGRVHVACGRPLHLDLAGDVAALSQRVVSALEDALVTTAFHLRSFLAHHPVEGVDVAWLTSALARRGGVVLKSRLQADASPAVERTLRAQWAPRLLRPADDEGDPRLAAVRERIAADEPAPAL